jgi:hypothetical protein
MRILVFAILMVPAFAGSSNDTIVQGDLYPLNIVPTYDHGYLGVYEEGGVSIYKPDGSLAMKVSREADSFVDNVDIDVDGSVAAAISRFPGGTIAIFNPDGSLMRKITTSPYIPSQLSFAHDHSIWVIGSVHPKSVDEQPDFALLRHYAQSGELLGEFFPRSMLGESVSWNQQNIGLWRIRVAKDRIGIVLVRHAPAGQYFWIEADLDGQEIGHWEVPRGKHPAALTVDGRVYAAGGGLSVLDHATGTWTPVPATALNENLLGADGNSLVYATRSGNILTRLSLIH